MELHRFQLTFVNRFFDSLSVKWEETRNEKYSEFCADQSIVKMYVEQTNSKEECQQTRCNSPISFMSHCHIVIVASNSNHFSSEHLNKYFDNGQYVVKSLNSKFLISYIFHDPNTNLLPQHIVTQSENSYTYNASYGIDPPSTNRHADVQGSFPQN